MKEKIILAIAILCGIAAMVLTRIYTSSVRAEYESKFQMVEVVVALDQIAEGTVLTDEVMSKSFARYKYPKASVTTAFIRPENMVIIKDRKLKNSLQKKTPLMWSDVEGGNLKAGNLATMVNPNERALSIPVDSISSVTGLVEPNDHVDILGTFTFPSMKGDPQLDTVTLTILQNVSILATGKDTSNTRGNDPSQGARRGGSYSSVTILVTPKEAEMLVFAMQKGRLTLDLRNPADVNSPRDLTTINFNYLLEKIKDFNDHRQERLKTGGSMR